MGWSDFAQLGTRYPGPPWYTPQTVSASGVGLSAGWYHSLALYWDGRVYAGGWNPWASSGRPTSRRTTSAGTRWPVSTDASGLSAGGVHRLAVTRARQVRSWG